MSAPVYQELFDKPHKVSQDDDAHLGLWHTRFFDRYPDPKKLNRGEEPWKVPSTGKGEWVDEVVKLAWARGAIKRLHQQRQRLEALVGATGGVVVPFTTHWHFVTGLGLPHPVENGFLWHPTLGMPYLQATAVKGLLRAWLTTWAEMSTAESEARQARWLGTPERTGDLIFFDALPVQRPPTLVHDIMTPHLGDWYAEGDQVKGSSTTGAAARIPADWHSPNPIPFLAVEKATFLFAIAPRHRGVGHQVVIEAMATLGEALLELGAGAKTAVGYGRMTPWKAPKKKKKKPSPLEELADFDPPVIDFVRSSSPQPAYEQLASQLGKKTWPKRDQERLAIWIREQMRAARVWDHGSPSDLRCSRKVEGYLPRNGRNR